MQPEREHADRRRAREADRDALEHGRGPGLQLQALQEQHDLEALAVDAREAERDEPGDDRAAALEHLAALAVVAADPLRPVDVVDEPVHDHEQDRDRDEAGDRLQPRAERRRGVEQRLHEEPGRRRGARTRSPAPAATGLRRPWLAPSRLAVTAAKIRIASRPSRNTITDELKTTVAWLCGPCDLGRVGGPVYGGGHQVDEAGEDGEPDGPPDESGAHG